MIVSQDKVTQAMGFWEKRHLDSGGTLDGVSLPKECSKLADLLGVMWFHKEHEATIPDESELARLIEAAG